MKRRLFAGGIRLDRKPTESNAVVQPVVRGSFGIAREGVLWRVSEEVTRQ